MCSNMCSMCGGSTKSVNYAKQVDPPIRPYGTILGDGPPQNLNKKRCGGQAPCIQMCLPNMSGGQHHKQGCHNQPSSIIQVPCDPVKPCPNFVCEPCPPPPPTKIWLIKSSPTPQKSVCLPVGNFSKQECPQAKVLVCLPCPPPMPVVQKQHGHKCVRSYPFGVPQKSEADSHQKQHSGGRYLPPPEGRICPQHCIHVSDIKGRRSCNWPQGLPCVAHCFKTPLGRH